MKDLCEKAELIAEGEVVNANASAGRIRVAKTFNLVYTDHQFRVTNRLKEPKYSVSTIVKLRTMGGSSQESSMTVNGEASFTDNEKVVVFLTRDFPESLPVDVFTILGGFQGKFTVTGSGLSAEVGRIGTHERSYLSNFRREIKENLEAGGFFKREKGAPA